MDWGKSGENEPASFEVRPIGPRRGTNRSEVEHLARNCNEVWDRFSPSFVLLIVKHYTKCFRDRQGRSFPDLKSDQSTLIGEVCQSNESDGVKGFIKLVPLDLAMLTTVRTGCQENSARVIQVMPCRSHGAQG